ncbi:MULTISPECIES: PA1571 family protein [unclassified Pseudomonas]|uniref:PA1571 family protein n=1 Tax=unclassified Pseudomonas TaxID=196821 RepID=UPI0023B96B07|nr:MULTISPECIES: PA1571 family protein [unclassified Pseudomonas]
MSLQNNAQHHPATTQQRQQPVGGFIIDGQGREVPITEDMIQQACNALEESRQGSPLQG